MLDIIDKLLTMDPAKRLGTNGALEIKNHPFFSDINWETLLEKPPVHGFVPKPTDPTDTTYFWDRNQLYASQDFDPMMDGKASPSGTVDFGNFSFKNISSLGDITQQLSSGMKGSKS